MTMTPPPESSRHGGRRTLILLALVCAAPIVASYIAYYWLRPAGRLNYGELLPPGPAPAIIATRAGGEPLRLADLQGQWVLLTVDGVDCDERCEHKLYATRQARTIQGRERERVVRVWLQPAAARAPSTELLAAQADVVAARGDPAQWAALPGGPMQSIYLIDPLGNLVLRYPAEPDIKRLAKDLTRLLMASRIG